MPASRAKWCTWSSKSWCPCAIECMPTPLAVFRPKYKARAPADPSAFLIHQPLSRFLVGILTSEWHLNKGSGTQWDIPRRAARNQTEALSFTEAGVGRQRAGPMLWPKFVAPGGLFVAEEVYQRLCRGVRGEMSHVSRQGFAILEGRTTPSDRNRPSIRCSHGIEHRCPLAKASHWGACATTALSISASSLELRGGPMARALWRGLPRIGI
eukprot:5172323-Amphidinium_carterae.3